MSNERERGQMPKVLAYSIADATKIAGIGRTALYALIGSGKIDARKAGNRTLILAESLEAYLTNLPPADIHTGGRARTSKV